MKTRMSIKLISIPLFACMLLAALNVSGQAAGNQKKDVREQKKEMIQTQKVAFITRELQFSTGDAQKFWPLYNEYNAKKDEFVKTKREAERVAKKTGIDQLSDKQAEELIDAELKCDQQLLDLKKEYKDKLKTVIGLKGIVKLFQAEKKFNAFLLKQLKDANKPPTEE